MGTGDGQVAGKNVQQAHFDSEQSLSDDTEQREVDSLTAPVSVACNVQLLTAAVYAPLVHAGQQALCCRTCLSCNTARAQVIHFQKAAYNLS